MSHIEHVTSETTAAPPVEPGLHIAASDVQAYIREMLKAHADSLDLNELELLKRQRIIEWQKIKVTMGTAEFMRIGYCAECADEACINFRKEEITTKCHRHSPVEEA